MLVFYRVSIFSVKVVEPNYNILGNKLPIDKVLEVMVVLEESEVIKSITD
jgi:hypothetical protein